MRMNVFPSPNLEKAASTDLATGNKETSVREKPYMSPNMIRQKLEAHKQSKLKPATSPIIKEDSIEVGQTKVPTAKEVNASEEAVVPNTPLLNDPKAPETQEKLRQLISSGGFNFSEKERKVLSEVLKT